MDEIGEITDYINNEVETTPNIIWGTGKEEELENKISVTIIATGFEDNSIPELYAKKTHKKKITLTEKYNRQNQEVSQNNSNAKQEDEYETQQRTLNFDLTKEREEEQFVVHHSSKSEQEEDEHETIKQEEVIEKIKENRDEENQTGKNPMRNDDDLESLENEPAYKRKKIKIDQPRYSKESKISRYTLSDDEEEKTKLKENNSYLHDNVD
jgi:cell division protein FtsZ